MSRTVTYRTTLLLIALVLGTLPICVSAQSDSYVISQESFVRLTPLYQHWSVGNDRSFSQVGTGFAVYTPLGREIGLGVQTSHVSTSGDLSSMSGIADAKISLNYYIEKPGVVLSCGVNLPTGKSELTQDEFETSLLISNDVFDLQMPNVGQGLTLQPGLTWAMSLGERFSIGAGASYQYRAKYRPLAGYGDYDPGDEVLLTGGADVRLGETATVAADVVFTTYGADKLDAENVFASGNKVTANIQFRKYFGQDDLLISMRYRSLSANQIGIAGAFVAEEEKVIPDLFGVSARFHLMVSSAFAIALHAEGRFYQETAGTLSGVNMFGAGVSPEINLSSSITIPVRAKVQFGKLKSGDTLTGLELGAGIAVLF